MWFDTRRVLLVAGDGSAAEPLAAFDFALRKAGIADFNLIKVTSIVPPGVPVTRLAPGAHPVLGEGRLAPTIFARQDSNAPGSVISAAVGVGLPTTGHALAGIVYVAFGEQSEEQSLAEVRRMVTDGMHIRGCHNFDLLTVSREASVDAGRDTWQSVVAAAIFCDEDLQSLFRPNDLSPE